MRRRHGNVQVVLPESFRRFRREDWAGDDDNEARRAWLDASYEWAKAHGMTPLDCLYVHRFCRLVDYDPEGARIWAEMTGRLEYLELYPPDPTAPFEPDLISPEIERRRKRNR